MPKILVFCSLFLCSFMLYCQDVLLFGDSTSSTQQKYLFTGKVVDLNNKEPLSGAVIKLTPSGIIRVTDGDGTFRVALLAGVHEISIQYLGYQEYKAGLHLYQVAEHEFLLLETGIELQGVTVLDKKPDANVSSVVTGVEQLSIEKLELQTKFLGETDVLRSLQSVTGVTSVGEGASGINVRGGDTDENLILMDDNLIFNPTHALGFFSVFHPDMVEGLTLHKAVIPAKYGGRLSSVLDVKLREGSADRIEGRGGVGIASSRLVLEGPLLSDKASFIAGGRVSYVDWILKQSRNADLRQSEASFHDFTLKADARITETTKIGFTALTAQDGFRFADDVKFQYATKSASMYLRQLLNDHINITLKSNAGQYESQLFDIAGNDQSEYRNKINYLRSSISGFYQPVESYHLELGAELNNYNVSPGELFPVTDSSNISHDQLAEEQGSEAGFFIDNQWSVTEGIELIAGARYSSYRSVGPSRELLYDEDAPKTEETIADSLVFEDGEKTAQYSGFEPRIALRVNLNERSSLKLGYSRQFQYFSQISNTASATPIDIWQLSDYHIKPQHTDNYSIGYYRNFRDNSIQAYVTFFYRKIDQVLDYKDFARLLMNDHIETELLTGKGKAYGAELYFNKGYGRNRFEINYTYSRSLRKIEASVTQESVNGGDWYPSNYDKPHSLNLNFVHHVSKGSHLSVNFTYSTGRPTTAPISSYSTSNVVTIPLYSERNQFRIPDYHRLDVSYTVGPWGKSPRWRHGLTLSMYNVYFRKNAFSVFYRQKQFSNVKAYRVSVLGTMFPAITYDFRF